MTNPMWLLGEDDVLLALKSSILHAAANAPRSLQTAIGPSEVGQPCARRLAHQIAGTIPSSSGGDPWRPTIGHAAHAWLADALELANTELGAGARWIVEERLDVAPGLSGSGDVFDTQTGTVVDWKVVGPTSLKKQKAACKPGGDGPGPLYRTQVHLYGKGHANAGRQVNHVAIAFLPSAGSLGDAVWWSEPYDPAIADAAIARLDSIRAGVAHGVAPALFPATPESERACLYCPFYAYGTTSLDAACPGVDAESNWIASATIPA